MVIRTGNQMIAEGAVRAGCRFFAGYPITPASGIYASMIEHLQRQRDIAISAPDEISALAYCVGASMRGLKSMTATSGPGWALMIETVQYALMTETPVVIAMVQRLGPSTGGATQGAQGDILLAEFCTSGGYTIPILCPSTALECHDLTMLAFSWAEQLRMPVVLLADKEVGMTSESVDYGRLRETPIVNRMTHEGSPQIPGDFRMYKFDEPWEVPPFIPVGGQQKVTATGSAHNKAGELKKNDAETLEVLHHLEEKIQRRRDNLCVTVSDIQPDATTLLLSYGITSRAMREAALCARAGGKKVSWINLLTLFPIPEKHIVSALGEVQQVVIAEENISGQYRQLITHLLKGRVVVGVNKIGSMITPAEILDAII